jgi:hypothetical protein
VVVDAQSVLAVGKGMESCDGVLGVVGVDVEKTPFGAHRYVA